MAILVPKDNYDRELICSYLRVAANSSYLSNFKITGNNPFLMQGPSYSNYVPFLEMFKEEHINDRNLRFSYVDSNNYNHDSSIGFYDGFRGHYKLRRGVIENKYLDVSKNDVFLSPYDVILNLTNYPITVKRKGGIEQMFIPIFNSNLSKIYGGKLLIIEFYYFTNPDVVLSYQSPNSQNYLEVKANQYRNSDKSLFKLYNDALEYYNYMHRNINNAVNVENLDKLIREAPIVSVYVTVVTESLFELAREKAGDNSISGIYIPHKKIIVTIADIYINKDNLFPKDTVLDSLTKHLNHDIYLCEIVDNESKVSDRYINIYNEPVLVPKIKDTSREDGFYVYKLNKSYEKVLIKKYSFDEMNSLDFIFKSAEEAKERLDSEKIYKKKMADIENKHNEKMKAMEEEIKNKEHLLAKLRAESEKMEREHKLEMMNMEKEYKRKTMMLDIMSQNNRYIREMENYNRRSYFEERKYQRDETIETLKTITSIAGLLSTGILLYQKLAGK